jgi:hypothetical protein
MGDFGGVWKEIWSVSIGRYQLSLTRKDKIATSEFEAEIDDE